jgi:hypothetical protein
MQHVSRQVGQSARLGIVQAQHRIGIQPCGLGDLAQAFALSSLKTAIRGTDKTDGRGLCQFCQFAIRGFPRVGCKSHEYAS